MINESNSTTQANYTKATPTLKNNPGMKPQKKLFGVDRRAILTVIGLTSFLVLAMVGVYVALMQRIQTTYTTTPSESQASEEGSGNCSLSFVVAGTQTPTLSCTKTAYQDELSNSAGSYSLLTQKSTFNPGDTVVYKIAMISSGITTLTFNLSDVLDSSVTFLDSTCGEEAYNDSTKTLICDQQDVDQDNSVAFRVKINSSVSNDTNIINTANVTSTENSLTTSCQTTVTVTTSNACGESCTADSQCPTNHTCSDNVCVLNQCLDDAASCESDKCTPKTTPTPTPGITPTPGVTPTPTMTKVCNDTCSTNAECPSNHTCSSGRCVYDSCLISGATCDSTNCVLVNPTPTPAAPIGCNDTCVNNADCNNSSYICWNGRCRLDSNVNSATCTAATIAGNPAPAQQPTLPEQLPQTGLNDGLKILGIGIGTVLLGIASMLIIL